MNVLNFSNQPSVQRWGRKKGWSCWANLLGNALVDFLGWGLWWLVNYCQKEYENQLY
jgi:hypothetical protein